MLEQFALILKALPWTGPAVIAGAALGMLSMLIFPRRRTLADRFGFALLVWCLTVALVVTLSPVKNDYFGVASQGCDWRVWRPLDYHYWFKGGSRPPNVWLFLPAGLGVMLLDRVWKKFFGMLVLLATPPVIELIQDKYPQLKRSCSSQDVVDNWTGLVIGLAVGAILAMLIGIVRAIRRRAARRNAILADDRRDYPGRWGYDEADETAEADATSRLPLSGSTRRESTCEFDDFDDSPSSNRWYEGDDPDATERIPRR